jgi:cytochrome c oxidase assembly protein subunit 15
MSRVIDLILHPHDVRWRRRFTVFTLVSTVLLLAWGGVVTSIDAGLAVPDWPSSFDSYDPFAPIPRWYAIPPVLAEHGHRLLGIWVGLCTVILTVWTIAADPRRWMRYLMLGALALVIVQGVLGGMRVVWQSLHLAVVHACVAQLFFSSLAALWLFTTPAWLLGEGRPAGEAGALLRRFIWLPGTALYVQIVLGALLRHAGGGVDPALAMIHMTGAFVVLGILGMTVRWTLRSTPKGSLTHGSAGTLAVLLAVQLILGFSAYGVLLQESGLTRSALQVALNSAHLIVGAGLLASTVVLTLLAARTPLPEQHLKVDDRP